MQDFMIIGGGIAGISAGARLSHLGRVTVLEREAALAYHASGRSAALFEESYGKPSVIALNRASNDYHATANGGVLSPRGLMLVGSAATGTAYRKDITDMSLDEITPQEAQALMPIINTDVVDRVAIDTSAWDIDTDLLIQNFAREIRSNGGQVITNAPVDAITRTAKGWQVTSGEQVYESTSLVNATGAWVDQIAQLAGITPLGFTPLRRSMARIPAPGDHDTSKWPMVFGAGEDWYCKPDAGALIVSPAEEDLCEPHDAWANDMVLAEGLARYEEHVTEPVTRLLSNWAGLRTFAPDRQLVLGRDKIDSNFIWCAGQGGYGFQTAPAASQLLADLVAGKSPDVAADIVSAVSPSRFSA